MARRAARNRAGEGADSSSSISIRELANHLGLSTATVSFVINGSPNARSIPQPTKERVWKAAKELNYRPNLMARFLRQKRSLTIGVIVPEISEGYAALVLSGIEDHLLQEGYFYFVVSHRHRSDLIEEYPLLLQQRAVEGIIAVDTVCHESYLPGVAISGHKEVPGVTNIVVDHMQAARLALDHLTKLGHRRIALMKGQDFSSDTEVRWNAVLRMAKQLGITVPEKLRVQLEGNSPSPELGYVAAKKLLTTDEAFTALFAFNDISAIGAIQALREAGKNVPLDVSVVGFDNIQSAAYQNPALTTVQQPLRRMGVVAAETLLQRINATEKSAGSYPKEIVLKPELIVRATTSRVSGALSSGAA